MAKKTVIQYVDDLDGEVLEEYETVQWALDGRSYEFDTSPENAEAFRDLVASYVRASRKVGSASGTVRTRRRASAADTQKVREWAAANGHTVSDRGRIPGAVQEAYDQAH